MLKSSGGGGSGAVSSVNGNTGAVTLTATDVFGTTSDLGTAAPNFKFGYSGNAIETTVHASVILGSGQTSFANSIGLSFTGINSGPNDTYVAGTANYASISGGYDNIVNCLAGVALSQHARIYTAASHAAIVGGSNNRIETGSYVGIFSANLSVISGTTPTSSVIAGGATNTITGVQYAAILGGNTNAVTGANAAAIAGANNTVSGQNAVALCSDTGTASVAHAVVTGFKQLGYFHGGLHYGARIQSTAGDRGNIIAAQSQQTADATLTSLSSYGSANTPTFPINTAAIGRALVIGRQASTTNLVAYQCTFACHRGSSGNVVVDSQTWALVGTDGITIAAAPVINATNTVFRIQVTGKAATTIDWNADIQLCTVTGA